VILPPDATSLKLWAFPERHLLADAWGEMERMDFEAPRGLPDAQRRALRFPVRRAGTFQGFVIKMAAGVASADAPDIETWCVDPATRAVGCRGHWAQQLVLFPPREVLCFLRLPPPFSLSSSLIHSFSRHLTHSLTHYPSLPHLPTHPPTPALPWRPNGRGGRRAQVGAGDELALDVGVDFAALQPSYTFAARLRRAAGAAPGEEEEELGARVLDKPNFG
jgi:hypothetical protein